MTRLSHTFSKYGRLICLAILCQLAWSSTVSGRIDVSLAPKASRAHGQSLSDIVVWLETVQAADALPLVPQRAQLIQKDKTFQPHTLVIPKGSTVDFPNSDPIFHNAFSTFDGQIFDVGLYPPGTSQSVRFRRPGIVRVFCNIHPTMSAIIVVVDTPYFTKADRNGRYQIRNVPAGSYELHVFDERATASPDSHVPLIVDGERADTTVPPVRLSEVGYVHLPHKNKYGLDYPPNSTDAETYTALPK
jgi:plastocyanin